MMVSIIVPVYNVRLYLRKCVDSILIQSYKKLEIILVDDGSDDGSEMICDEYTQKDSRIKVIHKCHSGLVNTRKEGLNHATGDFICWVDSDDWVEPEFISNFVKLQKESEADIVTVAHYHDIDTNSQIVKNGIANGAYQVEQIFDQMLYTGTFYEYGINPHLCTKMIRTSIIQYAENLIDDQIVVGEDAASTYVAIIRSNRIAISDLCGYHYVQRSCSITKAIDEDEEKKISMLLSHLKKQFCDMGVYKQLKKQLEMYQKYLMILRVIEIFDAKDRTKILAPYGGFKKGEKIILYGAGVTGQRIFKYIQKNQLLNIIAWVDKNYSKYIEDGYDVKSPDIISDLGEFNSIIIANISEYISNNIREYLIERQGIANERIKWFTEEFLQKTISE